MLDLKDLPYDERWKKMHVRERREGENFITI